MNKLFFDFRNKVLLLYFPLFVFLINFGIKIIFIDSRDIALDEPFTLYYSQQDFSAIINMLFGENNPPFHFFFMHVWIKLFGLSAFSVRLPSLIFSSLTAVYIFKIGKDFFDKRIGLFASLIFTFSTMHIYFSHEARVYPLFVLLSAYSLYRYLCILNNSKSFLNYALLFIANLILIYSHFFGFFVLLIEFICLFFINKKEGDLKSFLIFFILLAICYIPNLFLFFHRLSVSTQNGTWVSAPAITEYYGNLNRFINNKYNSLVLIIITLFLVVLKIKQHQISIFINSLKSNKNYLVIFLWFLLPYTIMFLVSFKTPMFIDRYILYTSIPFYFLIAIFLDLLSKNRIYFIVSSIVFLTSMAITLQLNPDNNRRLKEVITMVNKLKSNNTKTIIAPDYAYMGFAYHYQISCFKDAPNTVIDLNKDRIFPLSTPEQVKSILTDSKEDCLYVQAGTEFCDPNNKILEEISIKYKHHQVFPVFQIYLIHHFYN